MSVIQFNLLPDVKLEYIKTKRLKRLMVSISFLIAAGCFAIAVLLFLAVNVAQKQHMKDLDKDITKAAATVQGTKEINKIITVQNQLNNLPGLHDKKPAASRLFTYLSQVTPTNVTFNNVNADFAGDLLTISGTAKDFVGVNTFVDTLKFTKYTDKSVSSDAVPAFSKVLLSSFSNTDKSSSFTVSMSFDPVIFDNLKTVNFVVPKGITTRSEIDTPNALFQLNPASTKQGAQ